MCGIAGIVALEGVDPEALMAMTNLVKYRGPNGFGFAYFAAGTDGHVELVHNENRTPELRRPVIGLGNRRLAILDVSAAGNQPMQIDDCAYCITFNGEIYNYKEVRAELQSLGHGFRTGTDTEVILRAYKQWGADCLSRFNGMWGFALWDRAAQTLFCARDRFGVKPFYYALLNRSFYFGSEIKQLLQASRMTRTANPYTVFHFLESGLLDFSTHTFFENVQQLAPGHYLQLRIADPLSVEIKRYWDLSLEPQRRMSEFEAKDEFRERFADAVKLRLRSDVPVGVCLSGGLDSSAVACMAKEAAPSSQFHSFSACFDDARLNEQEFISAVVSATSGEGHRTFPFAESFWDAANNMLYHQDEPVPSTNVFAQWCVMADAKANGIPVLLGGQGGDEVLCGYQKYRYFYLWHLWQEGDPNFVREFVLFSRNGTRSHWGLSDACRYLPAAFRRQFSLIERVATPELRQQRELPSPRLGAGGSLAARQKTDLLYASLPALLHYEDRNSMAHSIESRLPFLDYRLVEFAVNCASSFKLRDGWSKWLLREAMADTLPAKVRLRRTKLGFDTPQGSWMRHGMLNGHRDVWDTPRLRMERFISAPKLTRESHRFLNAEVGALPSGALFRAICLELWARVHLVS